MGVKRAAAEWAADPVGFVTQELGARLWERQAAILEAVRDHARVAVRSCNGSGKTFVAAHIVLWWLMSFQSSLVITTAPTERQVREVLWREIRRAYRGHEALIEGRLTRTSLELGDKHYAQGLSTNQPERFQGFHERDILFVVDEASGVGEGIYEAIEGSMTSAGAKLLLVGNPTALSGTFYDAFHRRRKLWHAMHISAFDTPNVVAGDIVAPGLVSPQWVADAAVNWGEDSPMYQVRVLGEFPTESEDTLIPLRLIEAAVTRGAAGGVSAASGPVEMGVDVARFGRDRSVICVRRGDRVAPLQVFSRQDTMATAGRVVDAIKRDGPSVVRIDEIGIGAGVIDRLREQGVRSAIGVNVSERAARPEHFLNLRAELYDGLRERFQDGRITLPEDEELIGELASLRYSFTSSGQVRLESKDDLRGRGLPSPDKADALMLAFAAPRRAGFRIWA